MISKSPDSKCEETPVPKIEQTTGVAHIEQTTGVAHAQQTTGPAGWLFATGGVSATPFLSAPLPGWGKAFPNNLPAVKGIKFPDDGWDPLLKAGVIAGRFAAIPDWQAETAPNDPPATEAALLADLERLQEYAFSERRGEDQAEIEAQAPSISEYFARLLACSPDSTEIPI